MTKKIGQKIRKIWKDKTGVSPIISVILMVAITVVLAATIWAWVSGFGGSGSEPESAAVVCKGVNERLRIILAEGGESYPEGGYLNGDYGVFINGTAMDLTSAGTWLVGQSLTFDQNENAEDLIAGLEYSVTVTIFDTTVFDKDILITG